MPKYLPEPFADIPTETLYLLATCGESTTRDTRLITAELLLRAVIEVLPEDDPRRRQLPRLATLRRTPGAPGNPRVFPALESLVTSPSVRGALS